MTSHEQVGIVATVGGLATIGADSLARVAWIVAVSAVVAATTLLVHWRRT